MGNQLLQGGMVLQVKQIPLFRAFSASSTVCAYAAGRAQRPGKNTGEKHPRLLSGKAFHTEY